MKLRLGTLEDGTRSVLVSVKQGNEEQWVSLVEAGLRSGVSESKIDGEVRDVMAFLALTRDARQRWLDVATQHVPTTRGAQMPFEPVSFRDAALFVKHSKQSAAGFAKTVAPREGHALQLFFSQLVGKTIRLPTLAGPSRKPAFYVGNPFTFVPDGATAAWPSHSKWLDYELEVALVLGHHVTSHDETIDTIILEHGAFVLINDFSARDTQADELATVNFGFVKSKSFCTAMATDLVTADELWSPGDGGRLFSEGLRCTVTVNGQPWSEGSTSETKCCSLREYVAFAALDEGLRPGELLGLGTVPNCCGLEIDRWLAPRDTIVLDCDVLGTLTNTVGDFPAERGLDFKLYGAQNPSRLASATRLLLMALVVPPLSFALLVRSSFAMII